MCTLHDQHSSCTNPDSRAAQQPTLRPPVTHTHMWTQGNRTAALMSAHTDKALLMSESTSHVGCHATLSQDDSCCRARNQPNQQASQLQTNSFPGAAGGVEKHHFGGVGVARGGVCDCAWVV